MKRIKLFEDFKVNNITQEDIVNTIKNDGKLKVQKYSQIIGIH